MMKSQEGRRNVVRICRLYHVTHVEVVDHQFVVSLSMEVCIYRCYIYRSPCVKSLHRHTWPCHRCHVWLDRIVRLLCHLGYNMKHESCALHRTVGVFWKNRAVVALINAFASAVPSLGPLYLFNDQTEIRNGEQDTSDGRQCMKDEQTSALLVPADIHGPLSFWKHHRQDFPILAETSRRLLCISASSAQSERDFSSVGRTITDVRSRISSSKVEATELLRWGLRAKLLSLSWQSETVKLSVTNFNVVMLLRSGFQQ